MRGVPSQMRGFAHVPEKIEIGLIKSCFLKSVLTGKLAFFQRIEEKAIASYLAKLRSWVTAIVDNHPTPVPVLPIIQHKIDKN